MLKLSKGNITLWAAKYDERVNGSEDQTTEIRLKKTIKGKKFLTVDQYLEIGRWKSKRPTKRYRSNDDEFVREVTGISFQTSNERLKIEVLTLLNGCKYPLASVILHFRFPDKYPILDFRALWSLKIDQPTNYDFNFWWDEYVPRVRRISKDMDIDIRTIDKALWEYSKEDQPK